MKPNVLYLTYDGLTDPLGQSQVLPYLCGLSGEGYRITIISFEKPDRFNREKSRIGEICNEFNLTWKPLWYHKRPPIFSTLYDLIQLKKLGFDLHRHQQFEVVHCRSYVTALIGMWMKRRFNTRFIFDMRGFWADERVEGGLWNLANPVFNVVYRFFKKKEKEFLKEADHVISLTENAKIEILSWKITPQPIAVIPTCVDLELFNPNLIKAEDKDSLRERLGIKPDEFVLIYLGSWGTWYLAKQMLAFFSQLKLNIENAKFLIVSTDKIELDNYVHRNDVVITPAPRHLVPLYISIASASIFFLRPSFSKKASSATKMGELMAMNVPVITNKGWGDVESIFDGFRCGYYLSGFSNQSFDDSLNWVKNDFKESRTKATELFDLKAGIKEYSRIYSELVHLSSDRAR